MFDRHFKVWPRRTPHHLSVPETTLSFNLEVTARRHPGRAAIVYYGRTLTYADLHEQVERLAGYLRNRLGVAKGDRVLLYMQNSPQFVIGYYAILRADAVVVPVNPMNRTTEMEHFVADTGARVALLGQELLPVIQPLLGRTGLEHAVVASYAEYADPAFDLPVPDAVKAPPRADLGAGAVPWRDALAAGETAAPSTTQPDDWAVFPYSSGTTGNPKGCMHTHRTVMMPLVAGLVWSPMAPDSTHLVTLPLFHVTGMQAAMNQPIYMGCTMVIMSRWDRRVAAELIQRHRVGRWRSITTMAIDFVNDPEIRRFDLSSLEAIGGGGAAMPEVIAGRLREVTGLDYIEGYGLSETAASTHINPVEHPKRQCLGIPIFDVDSRVVSVEDGRELPPGEVGEILIHGPQLFKGYWNDPQGTAEAFIELDGKRFFRTGDLGYYDEDGYFFIVDRVKRMINASGFKVWPTEVEALMLRHPAIAEVCVIASPDARRGETVKACVILRDSHSGSVGEEDIIAWCRANMAAYKCPSRVEIRDALPRSATGKLQWRELQEQEWSA
ncbi:long-chain fatty acid--CoA ligase [Azospirillum sp. TSO22-1]|uniref:long-chain fatty acid--CoA ligase n=1 Tax=Azospirillum sp. TSO22-1 TaxID=716789 RepID=UPI000D604FDA|nr:long-chain fatty acid--CoA ligase [Azospirillum sp. TSO22-1]PWC41141.1 long-chain fatty acid--CoA ligase [Azospirillum sp. TSO22-1]